MTESYSDALAENAFAHSAEPLDGSDDLLPPSLVDAWSEQEARLREFIRAHPLAVVCGALALGFVVARSVRDL
jgi:hypothetical protein